MRILFVPSRAKQHTFLEFRVSSVQDLRSESLYKGSKATFMTVRFSILPLSIQLPFSEIVSGSGKRTGAANFKHRLACGV